MNVGNYLSEFLYKSSVFIVYGYFKKRKSNEIK